MVSVNINQILQYGLNGSIGLLGALLGIYVSGRREKNHKKTRLRNLSYILMHEVYVETQHSYDEIQAMQETIDQLNRGQNPTWRGDLVRDRVSPLSENLGELGSLESVTISALLMFHDTLGFAKRAESQASEAFQGFAGNAVKRQDLIHKLEWCLECWNAIANLGNPLIHRMCRRGKFSPPGNKEGFEREWYDEEQALMAEEQARKSNPS